MVNKLSFTSHRLKRTEFFINGVLGICYFKSKTTQTFHTSMRRPFYWHTCKKYPVFKGTNHCLVISCSWAICTWSFKKHFIWHFVLRVVSAEFQTSRSEARQYYTSRKPALLDSYPHNLPNSVNIFIILETHGNSEMLAMTLQFTT